MVNRSVSRTGRCPTYPDTLIVAMYVWAVWHDRPLCWAADRANYSSLFRPRRLPSRSQFCRRIKTERCRAILGGVYRRLADTGADHARCITLLDGRGFRVHSHSTDPDATRGYSSGGYGRGYKVHALAKENGRFLGIRITSMNVAEKTAARELIDEHRPAGLLLADQGYDSGPLYDYADERGATLLTPLGKNAGRGHRPQSKARMFAKSLWERGGEALYKRRNAIERFFGQLSAFGGGLAPLPPWVRRLERVERWITAKVIIYHARLCVRETAA
jgi:transposase